MKFSKYTDYTIVKWKIRFKSDQVGVGKGYIFFSNDQVEEQSVLTHDTNDQVECVCIQVLINSVRIKKALSKDFIFVIRFYKYIIITKY